MNPNRSKRSLWIGGGIAVAAALAIVSFTIDFPSSGKNTAGTVAPAQRYRAEQPKAGDVKLGDQSVAQLMQTEAFDRFVKDPSTRALAADTNFLALARHHAEGLAALAKHPDAVAVLAQQANAQLANARAQQADAQIANARAQQANAQIANAQLASAQLANARAQQADAKIANAKADAFNAFGRDANALSALSRAPEAANLMAHYPDAFGALARNQSFASLTANANFADALTASALANANSANGTSTNAQQQK